MKKFLILVLILAPLSVLAAEGDFVPLVSIPGIDFRSNVTLVDYINALFTLLISAAAILAVIRIVIGGFKYMTSEAISSKGEAREDIQGAVLGLILLLGSWLILFTINPQILDLSALRFENLRPEGQARELLQQRAEDRAALDALVAAGEQEFRTRQEARDYAARCRSLNGRASSIRAVQSIEHCPRGPNGVLLPSPGDRSCLPRTRGWAVSCRNL